MTTTSCVLETQVIVFRFENSANREFFARARVVYSREINTYNKWRYLEGDGKASSRGNGPIRRASLLRMISSIPQTVVFPGNVTAMDAVCV